MFVKVSADLDGSAVFCRNGAVKRILCHANMNNGRLKFSDGLVWKSGRMVWNGICAKYGVQIV